MVAEAITMRMTEVMMNMSAVLSHSHELYCSPLAFIGSDEPMANDTMSRAAVTMAVV